MNLVQENKFLTGYIILMLGGVGFLGFKLVTASTTLDDANARYTSKASRYNSLRNLSPYPDRENLAAFEKQKKEAAEAITAFQAELAKREFPIESISPERFQDRLKTAVTELRAKALTANIELPKDFYLGFARYETAPPDKDVAPILNRDLKAIDWVVQLLINAPISQLRELKRPELPEERGAKSGGGGNRPQGPGGGPGRGGGRGAQPDLVTAHSFDVVLVCRQRQLSSVLNGIISADAPQFFILRAVRIANQNPKGPQRDVAPPDAAPAAVPDPNAPAKGPVDIHYIVGEELVEATLRIEIVDFAEPSASTPK